VGELKAPPASLAGFKGSYFKERERKNKKEKKNKGKRKSGGKKKGRRGKTRGIFRPSPLAEA